jgi:quinol monooxygenase YgiN
MGEKKSIVARLKVKEGLGEEFQKVFDDLFTHISTNEVLTLHYVLHRSSSDPDLFYMTEVYENQDGLDQHMQSPAFQALGGQLGGYIEDADLQFLEPIKSAKGLSL